MSTRRFLGNPLSRPCESLWNRFGKPVHCDEPMGEEPVKQLTGPRSSVQLAMRVGVARRSADGT
jgi:hypothetical protein